MDWAVVQQTHLTDFTPFLQGAELDDLYAEFNSASQEILTQLHGTSEYYSADTAPVHEQELAQTVVDPWRPDHQGSEDKNTEATQDATEELAEEEDDAPATQMLLDEYPARTRACHGARPTRARTAGSLFCFKGPSNCVQLCFVFFSRRKAHKAAVKASYQTNVKTIYFHLEEIIKKILAHKTKWTNKCPPPLAAALPPHGCQLIRARLPQDYSLNFNDMATTAHCPLPSAHAHMSKR